MEIWMVEIPTATTIELEICMNSGPIMNDAGARFLVEREVDRINGMKITVYSDEHPPPHFMVACSEGTGRFEISDCKAMDRGLEKYYRNIRKWHKKNRDVLIKTWNESRPSDCPVGKFRDSDSLGI